jgi:hypothetical protein
MTTIHTPGPWSLETVRTSSGVCHKVGPFPGRREDHPPRHACLYADYPSDSNPSDQELLANARLIAAAPELLEALDTVVFWYGKRGPDDNLLPIDRQEDDIAKAMRAIAKAKGEQQ